MSNSVVQRRVQIIIDESNAKPAYERLLVQQQKLTDSIEAGQKAGRDMTTELTKLEQVKAKALDLEKVISGKVAPSFRQTQQAVSSLRKELALMSRDAPGYAEKFKKFQEVSQTFDIMRGKVNGFRNAAKSVFQEIKTVALGVTVGNTITAITQSITGFFQQAITGAAKLSDELADIEKATGLTAKQVEGLNGQLGKINTRTATSELRQIAIALGQAGEVANAANITALDRINVALGDEFGGDTREIGNVLSVLRNNLSDIKSQDYAKDVTAIGNALNELGANGLATAPVVTDIANRIAGVAQTFGVTSGEILGTAASFQELGINVERGSTAYIKLLQKMAGNTETFAKVAGLSVKEFEKLLNEDINEALLKVAEGTKTAASNNKEFAAVLASLETEGAGASELLSKLAANGDLVRQKIDLATKSLQSNSSIIEEFNKKNETLGAQYDKLSKNIAAAFNSSTLRNAVGGFIGIINDLFDETNKQSRAFQNAQKEFDNTEKAINPLYDRYLALKNQTTLNAQEQQELQRIIQEIARLVPQAASAFDEYGNAIDINTLKLTIFREEQKEFLQALNREAITSLQDDIEEALGQIGKYQVELKTSIRFGDEERAKQFQTAIAKNQNVAIQAADELAAKYGVELPEALQLAVDKIKVATGLIAQLQEGFEGGRNEGGTGTLFLPADTPLGKKKTTSTSPTGSAGAATRRKKEVDARKRELESLIKELQGIEENIYLNTLDPYQKRLNQIALKYQDLFGKAGNDIQLRERVLRDMLAETQQLNLEFQQAIEAAELIPPPQQADPNNTRGSVFDPEGQNRERLAQRELEFIKKKGQEKLAAELNFLKEKEEQEILALKLEQIRKIGSTENTEQQIFLIEEKYRKLRQKAAEDAAIIEIQQNLDKLQSFVQGVQAVSDIIAGFEQARINRVEENFQKERTGITRLFEQKLITQEEYNRRSTALENRMQLEKAAIAKREHKRQQIINTSQILIDAVAAGIGLWKKPGFPANIPLLALLAGQTVAAIAKVNSTPPPQFADGGVLPVDGPSHQQGGIALVSRGRKIAEIEGGERIISKRVYRANKHIVDNLIAKGHNHDFTPMAPSWHTQIPGSINVQRITSGMSRMPKYASGGVLPEQPTINPQPDINNQIMAALLTRLNQPIVANVVYGQYELKAQTIDDIRYAGTIN